MSVGSIEECVDEWNVVLQAQTKQFRVSRDDATVFLFSAHQVLTDVLDDPSKYGFDEDDVVDQEGTIWEDDFDPTSEVLDILAERLLKALLDGRVKVTAP